MAENANEANRQFCLRLGLSLVAAHGSALLALPAEAESGAKAAAPHNKVVSFAPSNTELLFALEAEDKLVGVCSYCDYPARARSREKVGSFISANLERLTRLKPDAVLIVDGQEALGNVLKRNGFQVVTLSNNNLKDIDKNLRILGDLTGHEAQSKQLIDSFDRSLRNLSAILAGSANRPRVFFCTWPQPLLAVGKASFLNDVITTCSGTNIAANLTAAYPHYSTERLVLADPDIIILPHEAIGQNFLKQHPWSALRAVKQQKVFYLPAASADGLARPTTRIIEGLFWLAERLHPELKPQLKTWFDQSKPLLSSGSEGHKAQGF